MKHSKNNSPTQDFLTRQARKKIYPAPSAASPRWGRKRAHRGAAGRIKKPHRIGIAIIVAFALLSILFAIYFVGFQSVVKQGTSFEVTPGESVSQIASRLKDNNIISSADVFIILVDASGRTAHTGIYDIPAGTSSWRMARMIAHGDVASTMVTIPEGLTVKQIVALLNANPYLRGTMCDPDANCPRDGELFPDTYKVSKGTKRMDVMAMMQKKMNDIQATWAANGRVRPRPLRDWNDVVTLASIVQKETPKVTEMPIVASVYLNRLRKNMKLQADPTVVYVFTNRLGDMGGQPLLASCLTTTVSPYNTYLNYGLPPAPIANVGRDALRAVLKPADTNYYFFVADGTGGHAFARNLDEHNANRAKWQMIKKAINSKNKSADN